MREVKYLTQPSDWAFLTWLTVVHVGSLAAFFTFSWAALGAAAVVWVMTLCWGVTLGYHRYFTHRSFQTSKAVEYFLAFCGCMSGEGGPIEWVAAHRRHHTYSDLEGDPHSPLKSFLWAHCSWMFAREKMLTEFDQYKKFTPDMANDKVLVWFNKYHYIPMILLGVTLFLIGGWAFVVWGMCVRSVVVYHSTWFVNSASHVWGYRSYKTTDQSRNNWWVAALAFGEGWHNNHHAFQRSARHGFRWWEIDLTYRTIQLLWVFGLATQIHLPVKTSSSGVTFPVREFGNAVQVSA